MTSMRPLSPVCRVDRRLRVRSPGTDHNSADANRRLAVAPGLDWVTVRASVRIEGDFASASGLWIAQALLLQGPWIQPMLTGALPLTAGAYAVSAQHSTYVEVAIDPETG